MTVSEASARFSGGDIPDERGAVFGIDMSAGHDSVVGEFSAVTEGVCCISAKLSPRVIIRDFVDGDRAVAVSKRAEIRLKFIIINGDAVSEKILSAASSGAPLRCVYMECGRQAFLGNMLISLSESAPDDIYGRQITAVFSAC